MIIQRPHLCTRLDIWTPRYSDAYTDGDRVALLAKYKVDNSSPVIIIEFTKARHLAGQRFCVRREDVQRCKLDTNGKIACYAVPMAKLEHWDSSAEVHDIAMSIFA